MKILQFKIFAFLMAFALFSNHGLASDNPLNLIDLAKSISSKNASTDHEREKLFQLNLEQQKKLKSESDKRANAAETEQEKLKKAFDQNENRLAELEQLLTQRTGTLGEVFGVAKEQALELSPTLRDSMTSADNPNRAEALAFSQKKRIPEIGDLQSLLEQLVIEMQATGQVKQFKTRVIGADGNTQTRDVVRFGAFSMQNSNGDYLVWDIENQILRTLAVQPEKTTGKPDLSGNSVRILLDPTRGELFALIERLPSLQDRIAQGGTIGYVIIAIGIAGLLVALIQILRQFLIEFGVRRQVKNPKNLRPGNPLGRVLSAAVYRHANEDPERVEMRVDEAILQEIPRIERGQNFLKLLAAVAPLLGLLGTVVGMILTFQSIVLYGTSDPKLMANGISQALVTTVLGLIVAVPILFCHSLLVSRGRRLIQTLQGKSLAAMADGDTPSPDETGNRNELHVA
ncbi:MAG: MotA/TolQ/ExbB proton channel family protein [Pseudomonadota bacterium]